MLDILPVIIIEKIFDNLNLNSLKTLRIVSKDVKDLVDNSKKFSKIENICVRFKIQSIKSSEQFNTIDSLDYLMKKLKNLERLTIYNLQFVSFEAIFNLKKIVNNHEKRIVIKNFKGNTSKLIKFLNGLNANDIIFDYDEKDHGENYLFLQDNLDNIKKEHYEMKKLNYMRFFNCPTIYIMELVLNNESEDLKEIIISQDDFKKLKKQVKLSHGKVRKLIERLYNSKGMADTICEHYWFNLYL